MLIFKSFTSFKGPSNIDHSINISLVDRSELRLWFFKHGTEYPSPSNISRKTGRRTAILLPSESMKVDRFLSQLMFVPPNYHSILKSHRKKTILLYEGISVWWPFDDGTQLFKDLKCPVQSCRMTTDKSKRKTADLVVFWDYYTPSKTKRPFNQLYALYHIEPPFITHPVDYPGNFPVKDDRDIAIIMTYFCVFKMFSIGQSHTGICAIEILNVKSISYCC